MAVKDSALSRVKARDAQRFLAVTDPASVSGRIKRLLSRHDLVGVALMLAHIKPKPAIVCSVPGDKAGARILQNWAEKTFPNLPPLTEAVVIVAIRRDGWIDTATWGVDAVACDEAGRWAEELGEHHLYVSPFQTWFGYGTDGTPTRLTDAQLATLSDAGRDFVAENTHPDAISKNIA